MIDFDGRDDKGSLDRKQSFPTAGFGLVDTWSRLMYPVLVNTGRGLLQIYEWSYFISWYASRQKP